MIRSILLVALAVACASAQRWPMITVNAAGEIVLQSLTRAQSFQITPASVTTAPTSSGTASLSTATALTAGVTAFVVTTASSPATGHGVTLPTPSVGAQVTLIQSQTTLTSYTIWASASSVFINNDATTTSFTVYGRRVVCSCISSTRWNCVTDAVSDSQLGNYLLSNSGVTTITSNLAQTLTSAQYGSAIYLYSATAALAATYTLPACSSTNAGASYEFHILTTAVVLTVSLSSTSPVYGTTVAYSAAATTVAASSSVQLTAGTTAIQIAKTVATGTDYGFARAVCHPFGAWGVYGLSTAA